MNITARILKRLQEIRLQIISELTNDKSDKLFCKGYLAGLEKAESIVYDEQEKVQTWAAKKVTKLWQTGEPDRYGDYILIVKAHFDGDYGVKNGQTYVTTDFWGEDGWESFDVGEDAWELLYFARLSNLRYQLPEELGLKRSNELYLE